MAAKPKNAATDIIENCCSLRVYENMELKKIFQ
jgi:hypothetical protein